MTMLDHALSMMSRGWPVFPVNGKVPANKRGFLDASTEERLADIWFRHSRWHGRGMAVATGQPSGIWVLDIDEAKGAESLRNLEAAHAPLPATVSSRTHDGAHFYFRMPEEGDVRNSVKKLAPGLDVRGTGGYVVLPPSPHPDGGNYEWLPGCSPDDIEVADAPLWLLSLVAAAKEKPRTAEPVGDTIPENERNDTLTSFAGTMRRRNASGNAILAALKVENAEKCDPPLDDDELAGIASSVARYPPASKTETAKAAKAKSKATRAVDLVVQSGAELWHDPDGVTYADYWESDGIRRTLPLRSRAARMWLNGLMYSAEKSVLGGQSSTDALDVLAAKALFEGEEQEIRTRLAKGPDGSIYLDLGDESWNAVQVTVDGWKVVKDPPVRFRRPRGLRALPVPATGGSLEPLRTVLNVSGDRDWRLLVAWTVGALHPDGPYPVLPLAGEQGSAKTTAAKILRHIIDPNEVPVRTLPREERDLIIAAQNGLIVAIDNVSHLRPWLSDSLCRMSTGGGFSTRELYTTGEEAIFAACRPVILTAIEDVAVRGDLADRAIPVELPRIPDEKRRTEADLRAKVDEIRPGVLGALLDAVSTGLRRAGTVVLDSPPRMADFAHRVVACEPSLPWKAGEFIQAYNDVRVDLIAVAIEADPVAVAIQTLMDRKSLEDWEGTATKLLKALNGLRSDDERPPKDWPDTSQQLGGRVRRAAPLLRKSGLAVEKTKSGERLITITRSADKAAQNDEAAQKPPISKSLYKVDLDNVDGLGGFLHMSANGAKEVGEVAPEDLFTTESVPEEEAPWTTI